jgi:hypothetical protein
MAKYNAFLDIVKERHDPSIKYRPVCPYCFSDRIHVTSSWSTATTRNNHVTKECECVKCSKTFRYEIKEGSEDVEEIRWYVSNEGKILRGIPGCFEHYVYTCNKCGGDVHRKYLEKNSDKECTILSSGADENGVWFNHYRILFVCEKCGQSIESENDHFWTNPPSEKTYEEKVKEAKESEEKFKKWAEKVKITEEIGIVVINKYAVAKVEVSKE